jgi:hypothetical protein
MNQKVFLLSLIILAISLPFVFKFSNIYEGYENYSLVQTMGKVPDSQTQVLVQDTYPAIGINQISNNTSNDIWWHYPIFKLGSYDQITNNIRYPNNPDEGTCMPGSMCGALYNEKKIGNNYITPLPLVNSVSGTRVGYFTTNGQLTDSLPFRTDMQNILY